MANDKAFKIKNGLIANRYLQNSSAITLSSGITSSFLKTTGDNSNWVQKTADISAYGGVTVRPVYHYDMIANVFTADLQLDNIVIGGNTYDFESNATGWQTTTTDTAIGSYDSATFVDVATDTTGLAESRGRVVRDTGGTPSTGTGATTDADGNGSGFYLYFETTSPANSASYDFLLRGPEITLPSSPTWTWYENRTGTSMGDLYSYLSLGSSWKQGTVDLSQASYFTLSPTTNTILFFSNPPASGLAKGFLLEVTGSDVGFSLGSATVDTGQNLSFSSVETSPSMAAVKSDGTSVYVAGTSQVGCTIHQYNLTTAYDLTTQSGGASKDVSAQASNPDALGFSSDGTKMWVGESGTIYQYTLSTAWNVNTASYDSVTLTSGSIITGVSASTDGTKLFVVDNGGNNIRQHTLSTANDISTATGSVVTFSVNSQTDSPATGEISSDGTKFYVAKSTEIFEYDLSTSNDISTAQYNGVSFVPGKNFEGMGVSSNGKFIFIAQTNDDRFDRISISTGPTISWPSSIKWEGGTAPDSPPEGETDLLSFVTTDGGTTYYGKKVRNALA